MGRKLYCINESRTPMKTDTPRRSDRRRSKKLFGAETACSLGLWSLLTFLLVGLPSAAQAQFNYTTNSGTITITGYTGPGGAVTIPDTINGLPVTEIGDSVFYYSVSLTSITIPKNITSIGVYAFFSCTSLGSITIENGLTSIGDRAFESCTVLTSVIIPESVAKLGSRAFNSCGNLSSVTIGKSVASIGEDAFGACTNLSAISIDGLNSFYSSVDGIVFNKSHTLLIECPA